MKILYKEEIIRVCIGEHHYGRINGVWYGNTGGSILDWCDIKTLYDSGRAPLSENELEKMFISINEK